MIWFHRVPHQFDVSIFILFFPLCTHCVEHFCRYYGLIFFNGSKWILFFTVSCCYQLTLYCISIFKTCTPIHTCVRCVWVCYVVYRSAPNNDNDDFQFIQRQKKCLLFFLCSSIILFGVLILTGREFALYVGNFRRAPLPGIFIGIRAWSSLKKINPYYL